MNIYRRSFVASCPQNGDRVAYALELESPVMIYAEQIELATDLFTPQYHEALADRLYQQFGGRQVLRATHRGVEIETRRGFA
jgi:hypothetical protein